MNARLLSVSATLVFAVAGYSCAPQGTVDTRQLVAGEGFVEVQGGRVWYEIVGSGNAVPLLLLHGGPGATSYYLEPLKYLADERPVIFYDQLGCGRSERPTDSTLWTVERFLDELRRVRDALGLDEVHIFGHSWGTMLAAEYMLTDPSGVKSLVLASPSLSIPRWLEDTTKLRAELPTETQRILARHEEAGTTDSEEYAAATMEFYKRHLCRLEPWPEELEESFSNLGWDVYNTMWGPSEFHATGSLKDFDITNRMGELTIPVLFTAGRHDEATPEATAWYQGLIPGSSVEIFEESSHMTMLEEPERYIQVLRSFLRSVEADTN